MLTTTLQINLQASPPAPTPTPPPAEVELTSAPTITSTKVRSLTLESYEIRWTLEDSDVDLNLYQYVVQRSEGPEGPWTNVTTPLQDTFLFIDRGVNQESKLRNVWYRVRIEHVTDSDDFYEGAPAKEEYPPDHFLLEIQRRERLYLQRYIGIWCAIFLKKTFGMRCPRCWDHLNNRSIRSDCTECYFTTYQGGYMSQINTYVALRPSSQVVQISELGESQPRQTDGWLSNSPIVKPGDLIVEPSNRRWRITAVQTTERRRSISRQILNFVEVEKKNIEYELPVTLVPEPLDTFAGFYPKQTPGIYADSRDRPRGSGLL